MVSFTIKNSLRYVTFILMMLSSRSRSQTMQGIVKDAATGMPLYPVIVVNETTQQAVSTDANGFYAITAKPGEAVAFSFIGYATSEKPAPASGVAAPLNVFMERANYELQEFKVKSGNHTQYYFDSMERAEIYKVPLERTPPSPIMSPASAIAEKFSRRAKTIYKFQKTFEAGEIEKFIDTRYYPDLVTTLTGLTGDSIGHFMYACPMPYDFARAASDLEVKMWIRSSFKSWSKNMADDSLRKTTNGQ